MTENAPAPQPSAPAARTVLVLAEDALAEADVQHVVGMHPDDDLRYEVLVPADSERNFAVELIDHLSVGELKQAWHDLRRDVPSKPQAEKTAEQQVAETEALFAAAGRAASGVVTADDPLPTVQERAARGDVLELVVVTYPHAVEDTFHRDWASRAREELGDLPVLHLYAGTSEIG
jgi:hypothetical protein